MLALAPFRAAPVRMRPSTGPAHGAHRKPVATPSSNDGTIAALCSPASRSAEAESLAPTPTNGRIR